MKVHNRLSTFIGDANQSHGHRLSQADIFEGIKNLELSSDTLLNYIEDLLAEIDERVAIKKKREKEECRERRWRD